MLEHGVEGRQQAYAREKRLRGARGVRGRYHAPTTPPAHNKPLRGPRHKDQNLLRDGVRRARRTLSRGCHGGRIPSSEVLLATPLFRETLSLTRRIPSRFKARQHSFRPRHEPQGLRLWIGRIEELDST